MPTPLEVSIDIKDQSSNTKIENEMSRKDHSTDPDVLKSCIENYQKNKQQPSHQQQQQQQTNFNGSPRRKFVNRSTNTTQNVGRHNRNNSLNKRSTSDNNNNNNNNNNTGHVKQFQFKVPSLTHQKVMHSDCQKLSNGHVEPSKKPFNKHRSTTKSNQMGSTHYDEFSSHSSAPEDSSSSTSPNPLNDVGIQLGVSTSQQGPIESDSLPRKYSIDFLHQVGFNYSNSSSINIAQQSPKSAKQMDDTNLLALKVALGDNSGYYNHFYTSSMYGSQMLLQHHQQQQYQQTYSRFQQSQQQQQQHVQRFQRMFQRPGHDGYQRVYHHSVYPDQEPTSLPCHCPQSGQNLQRNYQQSYMNSPSFQNRNKGDRREFRDNTKKHHRPGYGYHNGTGGERNFKSNKDHQQSNSQMGNSQSLNDEDSIKRKETTFNRISSDEQAFRSLSPTPPGSSKSSSPGAVEKCNEKDTTSSSGINFDLVDDSASTASASSSSGPSGSVSYLSDMKVSSSAPILLAPEEPTKNVNLWIDNNFGGALHNGLSISAEHLNHNFRDVPITIIKRPPSANGVNKRYTHNVQRSTITPSYDPQYPFDYYLSRSEQSEMRIAPHNLRCDTRWDRLSEDMWKKFQMFQQTRQTYHKKMVLWHDLHNSIKDFPLFHQKAFPKWGLYLVGSTISGFGSDTSDIDMCLVSKGNYHSDSRIDPRMEAMVTLNDLKNYLINSSSPFQNFSLINAKVPILRFRDASNKIEIDLNYNNCVGVRNTHLLYSYSQLDWRLRPLALIVKLWAQFHNINDARNSTISSYSLVLMTIHFLQYAVKPAILPCLHQLCPDNFRLLHDITTIDMVEKCDVNWKSENRQPLGELFVRFLDYYSNFDYANHAISIRTGGVLSIEECKSARSLKNDPNHWQTLCIEEPFDLTNTARSAYDGEIFLKIKDVFFQSFYRLKESRDLISVFKDPLFTQHQQQQYMSQVQQLKYMMMSTTSTATTAPAMVQLNDVKS